LTHSCKTSFRRRVCFRTELAPWDNSLRAWALGAIAFYQRFLSPILGGQCRFCPSCSQYAREAFETRPFFTALWLTLRRLLKCHPFHAGGYDPLQAPDKVLPTIEKTR